MQSGHVADAETHLCSLAFCFARPNDRAQTADVCQMMTTSLSRPPAADGHALPHIVAILADDYGWANVGYHHASREVATPSIDALRQSGIELTRHYAYKYCSPSRCSFQTGRLPVHVNTRNAEPTVRNPADPGGAVLVSGDCTDQGPNLYSCLYAAGSGR